jgi:predicted ATPase/class 3 adenylate cyclase
MADLPTGTVTFLMTDIVGSTPMWERDADAASLAMKRHDEIGLLAVQAANGFVVRERGEGDSMFAVFSRVSDALRAADRFMEMLSNESWPDGVSLAVRAAIHTGEVELRDAAYYGSVVNRCARLRAVANGGQVLVSRASSQLAAGNMPDGLRLYDLGIHRLKDLLRPEQIYVLHRAGDPPLDTALQSLEATPNNLPVRLTSFVGRTTELEAIADLLASSRIVTLVGTGGAGKTTIAVQAAAELSDAYTGGVWFVDLSSYEATGRAVRAIASTVDPQVGKSIDDISSLCGLLTRDRLLLILDNCEQIVEEVAMVAKGLLEKTPGLTVLATSREPLRIGGEQVFPIQPMSFSASPDGMLLDDLMAFDSFRLFWERAVARKPGLRLDQTMASDIAAICQAVDGLPLAVEQVASHVSALSVRQIRDRLNDRLSMARTKDRGLAERHVTLRATISLSYETLSPQERTLFAQLAIFPAGWSLDAAESICGGEGLDIYDSLEALVNKSLVSTHEELGGETRFRFLETIRQFAIELGGESEASLRRRYFDWYRNLAESADAHLTGSEQAEWLARIDSESENMRRALHFAEDFWPEELMVLALALRRYWYRRNQMEDGLRWLSSGIERARSTVSDSLAIALNAKATFQWRKGDLSESRETYASARAVYEELGRFGNVADIILNLACVESEAGNRDESMRQFMDAMHRYEAAGNLRGVAWAQENIGILELNQGNYAASIRWLERCLPTLRANGEVNRVVFSLANMAEALAAEGEFGPSLDTLIEFSELWHQAPDFGSLAQVALVLAIYFERSDLDRSAILCGAIEALLSQTRNGDLDKSMVRAKDLVRAQMSAERYGQMATRGSRMSANEIWSTCQAIIDQVATNK